MTQDLESITLTTHHGAPVAVINGLAYGPADMTPAGMTGAELVGQWAARFAGQGQPARAGVVTWAQLMASGELVSYIPGEGADIDREIAETNPCPHCGGPCEFIGMYAMDSYRAFARCKTCDAANEF